jgi:UDP-N-acetylenolpyruvoylglucosamine reductase
MLTSTHTNILPAPGILERFASQLEGRIIGRDNEDFDDLRSVYNGMIDRRPMLIVQCQNVTDITAAVNFARENSLLTAVRGGGHNAGGLGIVDDGMVIDLSLMRNIQVNEADNTALVEPGCILGDVENALHPHGKTIPTGIFSTTGIAGLTLGGGMGHLTRKYGLTIDSLREVHLVLADGSQVKANARENEDLFWAVRGGGGNFGIVSSFLFDMKDVDTVYAGPMMWELEHTEKILKYYREFITQADNNVYGYFAFLTVPPVAPFPEEHQLKKMCAIQWCVTLDESSARKAVQPFRDLAEPSIDFTGNMPYPALQTMFDHLYPKGMQWYWKGQYIKEISDEAVALHLQNARKLPTPHSTMHLYPIDGEAHRFTSKDMAFSYRNANWAMVIVGVDPDPANKDMITEWSKNYWEDFRDHSLSGAYVNFMMHDEGQQRIRDGYRANYERLTRIKARYDPHNFFRVNQNILPA